MVPFCTCVCVSNRNSTSSCMTLCRAPSLSRMGTWKQPRFQRLTPSRWWMKPKGPAPPPSVSRRQHQRPRESPVVPQRRQTWRTAVMVPLWSWRCEGRCRHQFAFNCASFLRFLFFFYICLECRNVVKLSTHCDARVLVKVFMSHRRDLS